MKTRVIYVEDIKEIDTRSISVYDMNKRFIDSNGNMYGLRYNRDRRKVELIRILRTSAERAQYIQNRIVERKSRDRKNGQSDSPDIAPDPASRDYEHEEFTPEPDTYTAEQELHTNEDEASKFNADIFISNIFKTMKTHEDRFTGIMNNIQHSRLITHENRELIVHFEDLQRTLEIEAFQKRDEVESLYKEITEYPRPVSHYASHLSSHQREDFEKIPTDASRFHFILLAEMDDNVKLIYRKMLSLCDQIEEFIEELEALISPKAAATAKQALGDARFSLNSNRKEIKDVLSQLTILEQYLLDLNNFF